MKPFLGIDLTDNKKNEQPNGNEFLSAVPSPVLAQALQQSAGKAEDTVERSKLPKPLRILQAVCGIIALLFLGGILKADVTLAQGYQNAPWIYWTEGICAAVWAVLKLFSLAKAKSVLGAEENSRVFTSFETAAESVYAEMGVPTSAKEVDVLSFFYKLKNDEIKLVEKAIAAQYFNPVFRAFADEQNLYLANLDGKYAFPLSSITGIRTMKKHIRIAGWNKEEKFDKGIYKPYKLTTDNYGCVHSKYYHILEVRREGETFGIYIPCYELPVFEALTGLHAVPER